MTTEIEVLYKLLSEFEQLIEEQEELLKNIWVVYGKTINLLAEKIFPEIKPLDKPKT